MSFIPSLGHQDRNIQRPPNQLIPKSRLAKNASDYWAGVNCNAERQPNFASSLRDAADGDKRFDRKPNSCLAVDSFVRAEDNVRRRLDGRQTMLVRQPIQHRHNPVDPLNATSIVLLVAGVVNDNGNDCRC